ncbi:MAG TPA: glutathione S-transferase family protein [Burkholderiaceae bacterium]|nr:glutathione S-transferase family protein [Burkholderiaceae bacterium]
MADLYLHHYPMSPFAEKVRLMLGFKQLAWHSVIVPSVMPKPDVVALTGGYRKVPFLQMGNDVFCDTNLIAVVLEHLAPTPSFFPNGQRGLNRVVAQWADHQLFWAGMAYNFQPRGMQQLFEGAPPEAIKAFGADRGAMSAGMTRVRPGDGTSAYRSYLRRLADMLAEQETDAEGQPVFLLGHGAPSLADFAAYHTVWFTRHQVPSLAGVLDATPAVADWLSRMVALGHGSMVRAKAEQAIAASAAASSAGERNDLKIFGEHEAFQDDHGIPLGTLVTLAAESFGTEVTEGTLLAATRTRYTLQHTHERAGTVRVHFPRVGYVLKAVA